MPAAPPTAEGYFMLHDFRRIDWDEWRDAPDRRREAAVSSGRTYLAERSDLDAGETAVFTVAGHKADLLFVHLRETLDAVERAERQFEATDFAGFTEQSTSYVSVTEIGGYTAPEYFEDPASVDPGIRRYMETKRYPEIPEDVYVSFYPMSKRRDPEYNWYDLPMAERAEMMAEHGETGKEYAGQVTQIVASSLGLDDWEWGVTLFATDATALKDIVYEMRFDEGSAKYAAFGPFYTGRRFPPGDLGAFMAGEAVPTGETEASLGGSTDHGETEASPGGTAIHGEAGAGHGTDPAGSAGDTDADADDATPIREELSDLDVYGGKPHGEDVYALALYSEADPDELAEEVFGLRENFEHYDTHVKTAVYEPREAGTTAVVSIWETESAADTASGFLVELPGVVGRAGADGDGWGTMGMFYTVEADHRTDFLETFDEVAETLASMDGHRDSRVLINREDDRDMFIASQWDSREDAMAFFRSDAFGDTVSWGRDVLVERPRHVFLA